jgi:hypothetical protein
MTAGDAALRPASLEESVDHLSGAMIHDPGTNDRPTVGLGGRGRGSSALAVGSQTSRAKARRSIDVAHRDRQFRAMVKGEIMRQVAMAKFAGTQLSAGAQMN